MFKVSLTFLGLLVTVISAVASDVSSMKYPPQPCSVSVSAVSLMPCSNKFVSPAFKGRNQCERIEVKDSDIVTCRPNGGNQPPAFYPPQSQTVPPLCAPPVVSTSDDTKMGLAAIIGMIACGAAAVAGVFIRKRKEDTADEHTAELKATKEKVWREKAIKLAASKHVANS